MDKDSLLKNLCQDLEKYDFDKNLGWKQVAGKGEHENQKYGEFAKLTEVIDKIKHWN